MLSTGGNAIGTVGAGGSPTGITILICFTICITGAFILIILIVVIGRLAGFRIKLKKQKISIN
jgi:hypothetical protein